MSDRYSDRAPPPGDAPPRGRPRDPLPPRLRENPWIWLAAVGLVGVLIVVVVLALRDDESEEREDREAVTVVETTETETAEGETVTVTTGATTTEPAPTVVVPDVVGREHVEAGAEVDEAGLIADSFPVESGEPRGVVVSQDPEPGTEVPNTDHVGLAVSLGPGERPTAEIPDVTGPKAAEARAIARETGFTVRTVDRDAPTVEEVDEVILQEPAAGTRAPVLTQITLYVGR